MAVDDEVGNDDAGGLPLPEFHVAPGHLLTRVASALVLIPLALAAVWLGGFWFAVLLAFAGFAMGVEWAMMIGPGRREMVVFISLLAAISAGFVLSVERLSLPVWGLGVLGLGAVMAFAGLVPALRRAGWLGVALIYCWTPVYALLWLRTAEGGLWLVAWTLIVVWGTDIGGYFVGRSLGGAKLVPQISPNKTWSGLFGGMALAALASGIAARWYNLGDELAFVLAGALLAIVAQGGDILESAIKRHFGVKDSGKLIPGHGGILDRVDGLVTVAPVVALAVLLMD